MQNIEQYIEQLTRMELKPEALQTAIEILEAVPQIQTELENPSVSKEKKEIIIQKIFPKAARAFLLTLSLDGTLASLKEILDAYTKIPKEERAPLTCVLEYVIAPDEKQYEGILQFLKQKYPKRVLNIEKRENMVRRGR